MFQPAQLLQVRQALAQEQEIVVAAQQAEIQKRIDHEAEATKRAGELVKVEKEKQKQKSDRDHDANATRTPRNKVRMARPHGDRQVDAHTVL